MDSITRRQREKQSLRERILVAARELFATQGYEAVTMRQIAQKIEYTPTAIYFHFKDKEQLIQELCSEDFLALARSFQHLDGIKNPADRLRHMALEYMDFGLKHPNHYRLLFMTPHPHKPPEEVQLIRRGNPAEDAYAFLRSTVIECMAAGHVRKDYRDPELVAQLFWAAIHGVTSLHIARGNDAWTPWRPARVLAEAMLDAVTDGMLSGHGTPPKRTTPQPKGKPGTARGPAKKSGKEADGKSRAGKRKMKRG